MIFEAENAGKNSVPAGDAPKKERSVCPLPKAEVLLLIKTTG